MKDKRAPNSSRVHSLEYLLDDVYHQQLSEPKHVRHFSKTQTLESVLIGFHHEQGCKLDGFVCNKDLQSKRHVCELSKLLSRHSSSHLLKGRRR
ncbi:hypothetical protein D3C87_1798650 [compost metagenome]